MPSSSNTGVTHPPRSNPPLRSSSGAPSPCITPSTVTIVTVVSFMVAAPLSLGLVVVRFDRTAAPISSVATGPSGRSIPHPCRTRPAWRCRTSERTPPAYPGAVPCQGREWPVACGTLGASRLDLAVDGLRGGRDVAGQDRCPLLQPIRGEVALFDERVTLHRGPCRAVRGVDTPPAAL